MSYSYKWKGPHRGLTWRWNLYAGRDGTDGAGMATGQAFYPRPPGSIPGRSILPPSLFAVALAFEGLGAGGVFRSFSMTSVKGGRREPLSAGLSTAQLYQPPKPCAMRVNPMSTAKEVYDHLNGYLTKFPNTKASDWYAGIATDARDRLFNAHQVNEQNDAWAYATADSNAIAREVEGAYHDAGYDGGPGGGDNATRAVYVYLKTRSTKQ